MKEKLITRLVMGALVGLAATGAYAGQIQSSSVSIAREVITTDTQPVTSPRISYRFAGDVDARSQVQTFQVQFILGGGALWDTAGAASNVIVSDGVTGAVIAQAAAPVAGGIRYHVDTLALSADKTTLYATISVWQDAVSLIKQPIVAISGDTVVANNPTVKNLKTVVGTIVACDTAVKNLPVSVKHYVALSAPASLASDVTATADEHNRVSAQNTTTLIAFPTNILVGVTAASGGTIRIQPGGATFSGTAVAAPNTWGTVGTTWGPYIGANLAILGSVWLTKNALGYDTDLAHQYLLTGNPAASGVTAIATATLNDGNVEASTLSVKVSASQGFATGGSLFLSTSPACGAAIAVAPAPESVTLTGQTDPITLSIATARLNASLGATGLGPIAVCYNATGTINSSSFNVDEVRLVKSAAGANLNEQDNYCSGPLLSLSGSVKIDVRNYANSVAAGGWMSVIRVINNSETRSVDVYGQIIQANGSYGPWGKLISQLKPRAVAQWTASALDALLVNAPAASVNGSSTPIVEVDQTGGTSSGRLRITSPTATTLRVQNYLYNPGTGNFIEASSSEAVDFDASTNRAPANEGQLQTQDAQAGLNGGN